MKRYYKHYQKWEDYQNGMYDAVGENKEQLISAAISILNNPVEFYKISLLVIKEWKVSAKVNLTNESANRQAWIGQAACCYFGKVPEIITRKAWERLSENERFNANLIADRIIEIYEEKNWKIFEGLEKQGLQKRNTGRSASKIGTVEQGTFL